MGYTLIVWKLDRLGRSLPHLLTIVTDLKARGIAFRLLTEQMDTNTPHGELLFSLFGALAQFERALTRERVPLAGLSRFRPYYRMEPDRVLQPRRPIITPRKPSWPLNMGRKTDRANDSYSPARDGSTVVVQRRAITGLTYCSLDQPSLR